MSIILALGAVLLGDLNAVAAVVTMFFLTVYGTVNFVAAFESLSGDPSWRPGLASHWTINLAGGLACLVVMMLINPLAGLIALVAELVLWLTLSRRERKAGWGDARRGLYESVIRWALVRLANHPMTPRNWRPHILVYVDDLRTELDLVRFADWFSQKRGVVTVCKLKVESNPEESFESVEEMRELLDEERLIAFPEVDSARHLVDGMVDVAQANGIAGIASNTIMIGWPSDPGLQVEFLRALRRLEELHKSVVFARIRPQLLYKRATTTRRIVVWWGGLQRNGDLMLLLAFLLSRNSSWRRSKVTVMSLATTELMQTRNETFLRQLLDEIRIDGEIRVLLKNTDETVAQTIRRESEGAEVVMLGLATPEDGDEENYAERLEALSEGLPTVFFVKNASPFGGHLVSPEVEVSKQDSEEGERDEDSAE